MNKSHPDIMIFASYPDGNETLSLRLVTLETKNFPWGILLGYDFTGPTRREDAEAVAKQIQEYLNDSYTRNRT